MAKDLRIQELWNYRFFPKEIEEGIRKVKELLKSIDTFEKVMEIMQKGAQKPKEESKEKKEEEKKEEKKEEEKYEGPRNEKG